MRRGTHTRLYSHVYWGFLHDSGTTALRAPTVFSISVRALLDKRLVFVTGKGGVGKSTVAIALGLVAARTGRRCIVAELAAQERIQGAFDRHGELFEEVELAPGLSTISIDPQHAMEEYLKIKAGPLGHALSASRVFGAFAMATPGMRELLSIGKIWELAQLERRTHGASPYDLVIVDAPATGHGLGILRTPRTFADIAIVGPIAHQARTIADTIDDRAFTGVIAVATAEEMPVNETLALREALQAEQLDLDAVILNALYPKRFAPTDVPVLERALKAATDPLIRASLKAAISEQARAASQHDQQARLAEGLGLPLVELPYVFAEEIGPPQLELLADVLAAGDDTGPRDPEHHPAEDPVR
jgi:anion-transporting  ArsA/GET3 family ATPase